MKYASRPSQAFLDRYAELQRYVGFDEEDAQRMARLARLVEPHLGELVDDFYQKILEHPGASRVLQGDETQIARLKESLASWCRELFAGCYDADYVRGRWRVGLRHAEIGLEQVYTHVAMTRLRIGMMRVIMRQLSGQPELPELLESLNRALDLDLSVIQQSYEFRQMQKEKLAERKRGQSRFRNLVEAAGLMIVILRDDQRIAYFSPFAEELTGYSRHEVEGRDYFSIFMAIPEGEELRTRLMSASRRGGVKAIELPIKCRDGSRRWLLWNALRMEDFDGEPAILAVGHDITEKRQADEKLLQAERLAAIGTTVTGLAHESRNALQRIHSCTELLEFEVEDNPEAIRLIRRAEQAQEDLRRLFDEVRGFAAPLHLERQSCKLPALWQTAWEMLKAEREGREIRLRERFHEPLAPMSLDKFRMIQVFRNLLENALAACPDPVEIEIVAQLLPRSSSMAQPEGSHEVEVRIRDNGPGIDPAAQSKVFQPFFTTKAKGTGLGMPIAQRTVEAHGGSLTIGDAVDGGAEFVLRLPYE